MTKPEKPLREAMPEAAAFIDEMRAAFGKEHIDGQIRLGMQGAPNTFYAAKNGHEVGTKFAEPKNFILLKDMVILTPEEREKRESWKKNQR